MNFLLNEETTTAEQNVHLTAAQQYVRNCKKEQHVIRIDRGVLITTNPEKWEAYLKKNK